MFKFINKTAILIIGIAFFCLQSVQASENLNDQCYLSFRELQKSYTQSNADFTIVSGNGNNMIPYALNHRFHNERSYSLWKSLNGEVSGYFLRNGYGFNFNQDRNSASPLSWHQTNIWDRLFDDKLQLQDYNCMIAGRTRLSGHKVTILRLAPEDDLRYSFIIAKDEDSFLPVELNVINPSGVLALKLTATVMNFSSEGNFAYNDELFDHFDLVKKSQSAVSAENWPILNIPKQFSLLESGIVTIGENEVPFLRYGDGITDFRVYRHKPQSLYIPSAVNGTLTVLRRSDIKYEYAVVGEIPLQLSEFVLKRLSPHN